MKLKIKSGSICVLWKDTHLARLVRVTRRAYGRQPDVQDWYTRPYLDQGYPEKQVAEHELTPLTNEMEIIAWASK